MKHFSLRQTVEGGILALIGAAILLLIPAQVKEISGMETKTSPSFFPYLVSMSLILIGGIIIFQGFFSQVKEEAVRLPGPGLWRAAAGAALLLAYTLLFPRLGFVVTSGIFMGIYSWLFGSRSPLKIALGVVILPVAVWLFFERLFQIPLPHGLLF